MKRKSTTQSGRSGEETAMHYLQGKGYRIHCMNYRFSRVEIDIIAQHEEEVIFVEVKTRRSAEVAFPEQAVGKSKQRNIRLAAENFLAENQIGLPARFDIIAVINGPKPEIVHFEDAFYPFDAL